MMRLTWSPPPSHLLALRLSAGISYSTAPRHHGEASRRGGPVAANTSRCVSARALYFLVVCNLLLLLVAVAVSTSSSKCER